MKKTFPSLNEQLDLIKSNVAPAEIISEDELAKRIECSIKEGRPLRIKQGFDASSPDLHVGHAVSIWKLRTFQDLGHTVVFVIGDFTAMVGDPSGKSKTRPRLTREQVEENSRTYNEQVFRILDQQRTEIRFNSEWHSKRDIYAFLDLCSRYTVRRMLERDDFWKRFNDEQPISILEFLYPLMQAYDSVALQADVELGGTDQKFNLLLARQIQRAFDQDPQVAVLMPLVRGTDGTEKMSKSLNNAIGIADDADEMYGKIMSIADDLLEEYYYTISGLVDPSLSQSIEKIKANHDPYRLKHDLAKTVVTRYHDLEKANQAAERFLDRFRDQVLPSARELVEQGAIFKTESDVEWLPRLICSAGAAKSNGEALRLIKAGAVSLDGEKVTGEQDDLEIRIEKPVVLKVGKRRFFLLYRNEEQLQGLE